VAKFKIPADIKALDADKLDEAVKEAAAALDEFNKIDSAELSDEQIEDAEAILGFVTAAQTEFTEREAADQAREQRLAAIREFKGAQEEEAPKEGDKPAEEAPKEEEKAAEPQAASGKRQSFAARAASKAPVEEAKAERATASLTASANVPGVQAGTKFETFAGASEVIMASLKGLPTNKPKNTVVRNSALSVSLTESKFTQDNRTEFHNDDELLLAASRESRLTGGSLVAAGGWGAPSEQSLDFCALESIDGLYTGPEVTITRGGVQYTKGPSMADIVDATEGFWDMTEAVAEAGTELKTSLRPTVPEFEEERLDAVGVMVEAGLLLRKGWPEVIDRYATMAMTLHQWKMSRKSIKQIEAFTGAAVNVPNGFGNALDVLNILDTVAMGERQRNFMSTKATLEVLLPHWVKTVIKIDLSNRSGVDVQSVTDAQIDAYFTARNLRVQWLNAYQDLPLDPTSGLVLSLPDSVEAIMYPAGTYVRGVSDVISLDTIYDSVNLKKNDYVHLFVEQGVLMTNPCGEGKRISLPLVANGRRAANDITRDFLNAVTP
jgi:hypothetical protein